MRKMFLIAVAVFYVVLSAVIAAYAADYVNTQAGGFRNMSEKKVALVIGNSAYRSVPPLKNPVNDAADVGKVLGELGFQVIVAKDASLDDMDRAIYRFEESLKGGGVGLFYYSGHGIQIKGENYLIPVDADLPREEDVKRKTISANDILDKMDAARCRLNMVFMDACRSNPFPASSRSTGRGLAEMKAPAGSLVVFSTNPGNVALDGVGRNGAYTKQFLRHVKSDLEVGIMLRRVRTDVKNDTAGRQVPWESGSSK